MHMIQSHSISLMKNEQKINSVKWTSGSLINFYPLKFHKGAKEISLKILSSSNPSKIFLDYKKDKNIIKNIKISSKAKIRLKNMMDLYEKLNLNGTPMVFVIKDRKIIDFIKGANINKISKYFGEKK